MGNPLWFASSAGARNDTRTGICCRVLWAHDSFVLCRRLLAHDICPPLDRCLRDSLWLGWLTHDSLDVLVTLCLGASLVRCIDRVALVIPGFSVENDLVGCRSCLVPGTFPAGAPAGAGVGVDRHGDLECSHTIALS